MTPICLERNISKMAGDRDSFQRTTNRKWHRALKWSHDPKRCCDVVRLAILVTAWLLDLIVELRLVDARCTRYLPTKWLSQNCGMMKPCDRALMISYQSFIVTVCFASLPRYCHLFYLKVLHVGLRQ